MANPKQITLTLHACPSVVRAGMRVKILADAQVPFLRSFKSRAYYFAVDSYHTGSGRIIGDIGKQPVEVDTTGMPSGVYCVKAHVCIGTEPWNMADAEVEFEVC